MNLKKLPIGKITQTAKSLLIENIGLLVILIGLGIVGYTMHTTFNQPDIVSSEQKYDELSKEVVFTKFDQDTVERIRNLDEFEDSIESAFQEGRNNPFLE